MIEAIMKTSPVIPVIVINTLEEAVPLATALFEGGLKVLEVTLRTEHGLAAITEIKQALPDAIVGAGTVNTEQDVHNSVAAGAEFLVSPGCTPELLAAFKASGIPFLAGTSSPSNVMALLQQGVEYMKFFPAEAAGGVAMLKSIGGPLAQAKFCPTGGVNPANAKSYLALKNVLCVGGSWMLPSDVIANKDWSAIKALAAEAAAINC